MTHSAWSLGLGLLLMTEVAAAASSEATPASAPVAAAASEVSQVRIIQARAATPQVAVYLDIRSEAGRAIAEVKAEQLQADIGPYPAAPKSFESFANTGEGIATIFLVDVSKSLKPDQFAQIRSALAQWIEKMGDKDRAAIVTFGESVKTAQDFTVDKALLKSKIDELALTDVHTRLYNGLIRALDLGRREDADLPRRRVIVTLTDGLDDAAGGSTREETLARIKEEPVPIYAIGFVAAGASASDKDQGFKQLGAFAHASGGTFRAAGGTPLAQVYTELNTAIQEANLLLLECGTCPSDGRAYPLRVKLQADQRVLTATSEVRLVSGTAPPMPPASSASAPAAPAAPASAASAASASSTEAPQSTQGLPLWLWLVLGIGLVAGVVLVLRRQKAIQPAPQPAPSSKHVPEQVPLPGTTEHFQTPGDVTTATALPKPRHGVPIQLTAVSGAHRGREWRTDVETETAIGRAASCAVVIDDDSEVSSKNSVLSAEAGLLFVEDLGSTNGTAINGTPIKGRRRVGEGDLILVGRTELRITLLKKP